MKKFTSLILALVMALSLAVPGFAANKDTDLGQSTKITSATNEATIKVTVPATLTAVLNPYGIGYKVNDTWLAAQTYNQNQIASPDNLIISQSNIPLDVYVNAVGTPSSGVTLESGSVGTKKTKSVYMYAVFGTVDTGLVAVGDIADATGATHKNVAPPTYPATPSTTADATTGITNQIIIKTTALAKPVKVGTLAEVPYAGDPLAPQTISAISYKLDGDMVIAPENNGAANNWVKADKVDVDFTFTFTPGSAAVVADYTETATSYSFGTPANLTWDAKTKLTAATTSTTAPNTTDATAAYAIANAKVDGVAVATADNVAIAANGTVTIKKELFSGTGITGAQVTVRKGETHYVTFDITYVDVNSWTITKTIKLPITIAA